MRGSQECGERSPLGDTKDGRAFEIYSVHHGEHIVDVLFERWKPNRPVGQTSATLVEQD
jgi:hypothetical protein